MDNAAGDGGRPSYEAPQLTVVGRLADLTAMQHAGSITDNTFPAGTPLSQLTFS
ncbi:MAG TPA: lasso RiPP family leader peptide-containing protein [Acidimicrobiales bacterium]|jgi:hypothetical protein